MVLIFVYLTSVRPRRSPANFVQRLCRSAALFVLCSSKARAPADFFTPYAVSEAKCKGSRQNAKVQNCQAILLEMVCSLGY